MNFPEETLKEAHRHCSHNRDEIGRSERCGCFYCGRVFLTDEIRRWVGDKSEDAICPHCHIDSVIGDASGIRLTKEFLQAMRDFWFAIPNLKK